MRVRGSDDRAERVTHENEALGTEVSAKLVEVFHRRRHAVLRRIAIKRGPTCPALVEVEHSKVRFELLARRALKGIGVVARPPVKVRDKGRIRRPGDAVPKLDTIGTL